MIDIELGPAILARIFAGAVMEGPVYLKKALGLPVKQNMSARGDSSSASAAPPATSSAS